jgi:hypothetical protein
MSLDFDQELETFKSGIDLQRFAALPGYEKDKRESSKRSTIIQPAPDVSRSAKAAEFGLFHGGPGWIAQQEAIV